MVSKNYLNCKNGNHKLVLSYRDRDFEKNRIVKSCYCGKVKEYINTIDAALNKNVYKELKS